MDEIKRQELRLNAKAVLRVADAEGWSGADRTRRLAELALEAIDALKEQKAEIERLRALTERDVEDCPQCGSDLVYAEEPAGTATCRNCGHSWKLKQDR